MAFNLTVPANQAYTQPYWLVKPPTADVYQVDDQKLIGLPDTPAAVQVRVRLTVDGAPIELVRPVHHRYADRAQGERVRPFMVVPAVAVNLPEPVALFPDATARKVQVSVQANVANAKGDLRLEVPAGWKAEPASQDFEIATSGEAARDDVRGDAARGRNHGQLHAVAKVNGRDIESGLQVIAYPHIPPQTLFPPSDIKLVRSNIKVTAKKVGYIMGAGDEMPDALRQLGLDVTLLSQSDLEQGDLSRFDAIVAGVRAYNVRADIRANQPRLLEYVKNGGTYVVQYQTGDSPDPTAPRGQQQPPNPFNQQQSAPVTTNLGPYPVRRAGRQQVSHHGGRSAVEIPQPGQPAAAISQSHQPEGFRGLGAGARRLLRGAVGQALSDRALLAGSRRAAAGRRADLDALRQGRLHFHARTRGSGSLPAGVPGAYRLFANLLSAK